MSIHRRAILSCNSVSDTEPEKILPDFRPSLSLPDMSLKVRDQYKCLHKGPTKGYEQFIQQVRAKRGSGVKQTVVVGGDLGSFTESGGDGRTSGRSGNRIKRNVRLRFRISICLVPHNRFPPQ
jgi:hypothetical protein